MVNLLSLPVLSLFAALYSFLLGPILASMPPSLTLSRFVSCLLKFTLLLAIQTSTVNALSNVTVDDQSRIVFYTPRDSWARISDNTTEIFDFGGSHMLTSDPSATATFTFTGTAIYFLSARWPYPVTTTVTLDSGDPVILDLVDHTHNATGGPATVKSQVVARAVGLENGAHTITVGVGAGQLFGLVDGFIYTAVAPGDTIPVSTTPPPTQLSPVAPSTDTTSPTDTAHKSKSHALAIGLAIFFVLLFLIVLVLVYIYLRRRRRQRKEDEQYAHAVPTAFSGTGGASLSANGGPRTMRNVYAQGFTPEDDDDEKVIANSARKSLSLHVTNPDLSTANLNDGESPSSRIAMPVPERAHSAVDKHSYVPNGSSSASAAAATYAARLRSRMNGGGGGGGSGAGGAGVVGSAAGGDEDKSRLESALRSPGTYYTTLREMTQSPARAYPVPGAPRSSHPPQRKSVPAIQVNDFGSNPYEHHDAHPHPNSGLGDEGDKQTESDMRTLTDLYEEDSRSQYPITPATPYSHSRPYSQFRPPSNMQSHGNPYSPATNTTHTIPAQRSRTTLYSQVTALPLEEDGEYGYGGSMYEGSGFERSGVLVPPQAAYAGSGAGTAGRHGGGRPSSGVQGEERWAYPQTPLAYVPVFKS